MVYSKWKKIDNKRNLLPFFLKKEIAQKSWSVIKKNHKRYIKYNVLVLKFGIGISTSPINISKIKTNDFDEERTKHHTRLRFQSKLA